MNGGAPKKDSQAKNLNDAALTSAIDKLFEDEELPEIKLSDLSHESKKWDLKPSEVALEIQKLKSESGAEKRIFTRVDVSHKKLEVKFSSGAQFARQYIENISLGGLFVKTNASFKMGDIIPLRFSIPSSENENGQRSFELDGRVCRITEGGVGVEFLEVSPKVRRDLEAYIQSVLPSGGSILTPRAKLSVLERLEKIRERNLATQKKRKTFFLNLALIASLILLNFVLVRQAIEVHERNTLIREGSGTIFVGDAPVSIEEVRSISMEEGKIVFTLDGEKKLELNSNDPSLEQLPYHLQKTIELLRSTPPIKKQRQSQTSRATTRLR